MSRKKISEFRAKTILNAALDVTYNGIEIDIELPDWQNALSGLSDEQRYVVKVDQAVKGRFKKGLVLLDQSSGQVHEAVKLLAEKGYQYMLIEPYRGHESSAEYYLSLERTRDGVWLAYSENGGVDIEAHPESIKHTLHKSGEPLHILGLSPDVVQKLVDTFESNYFSFLEINPLLVEHGRVDLLDAAVEVDEEAEFFVDVWGAADIRQATIRSAEEQAVQELNDKSQASFSLEVLNPNGSIFLLLSGGGASIVVADEVYNLGHGKELANYGEYSGAPNKEETYIYTKQILTLLLKSNASHKVLIIGGGVANFTDVRVTFEGIIKALKEVDTQLREQGVEVFVRRGGPYQAQGLSLMKEYLEAAGIAGRIEGPDLVLSDIVGLAIEQKGDQV